MPEEEEEERRRRARAAGKRRSVRLVARLLSPRLLPLPRPTALHSPHPFSSLLLPVVQNVFAEPVRLDASWEPRVLPKTEEEQAEIHRVILNNILFATLDEDQRNVIVGAMERRDYAPGDKIIKQGDMGDNFYLVSAGTCEIFVNGTKVLDVKPGMGFGELALLYDSPRAATVVATSRVSVRRVSRMCECLSADNCVCVGIPCQCSRGGKGPLVIGSLPHFRFGALLLGLRRRGPSTGRRSSR